MTSEDGDDYMARFDHRRSIPVPLAPPSAVVKPKGGARLLSFFLRAVVMAVALALFFLFAGIAVLLLLLLCVVGRVLRRRRRFFHSMIRPMPEERCGLTPDEMRCLPCFSYEVGTEAAEAIPTDCAVCLDGFGEGEWCRALPGCSHVFHAICVDRWLEKAAICPICRGSVAVDGDDLAAVPPLVLI
ncbi:RING-H2 finger protein ATL56 [Apostasia shenzhenica]|uniref:RING-H2 finger protein ATL56 n=1 Tax=Apostasia shenzhenica TaxID=1088818 RepID=A0A2I0AT18_9ASPA|nr:RING-H2 finger protein ATL56 [Apostasia shenzhenica]